MESNLHIIVSRGKKPSLAIMATVEIDPADASSLTQTIPNEDLRHKTLLKMTQ